jgi:hypothetical protein
VLGDRFTKTSTEIRQDSDGRFDLSLRQLVDLTSDHDPTTDGRALLFRYIWTGKEFYDFNGNSRVFSVVHISSSNSRREECYAKAYNDAPLDGTLWGDLVPFTVVLHGAPDLRLDPQPLIIGGDACDTILGKSESGDYRVCLDPERDYAIRSATVVRRGDNELFGQKMSSMKPSPLAGKERGVQTSYETEDSFSITDVSITKIEQHWVPTSATLHFESKFADGRVTAWVTRVNRTFETFSPDFAASRAFVPDFPDGTRVYKAGLGSIRFTWQKGKVQAAVDDQTITAIDRSIDALPKSTLNPATAPSK